MAVAFNAAAIGTIQFATQSISINVTINAGSNLAAIVYLFLNATNVLTNPTATCGGVTGSAITNADTAASQSSRLVAFQVKAPATGAQTAVVSWTSPATSGEVSVVVASNVDQTTPLINGVAATTGFGSSVSSGAITSTNGDLTSTNGSTLNAPTTWGTNQTLKANDGQQGAVDVGPGTGTTTHTWTLTGSSTTLLCVGANFKAAAAGVVPDLSGGMPRRTRFVTW